MRPAYRRFNSSGEKAREVTLLSTPDPRLPTPDPRPPALRTPLPLTDITRNRTGGRRVRAGKI